MILETGQVYTKNFLCFYKIIGINNNVLCYQFINKKGKHTLNVNTEYFAEAIRGYIIVTELTKALL